MPASLNCFQCSHYELVLDWDLFNYVCRLPHGTLTKTGETKWILKEALRGVIPERVLQRKKQGFGVPINDWMMNKLGGFVESSLMNSSLRRRDLFDYEFIKRLLNEHRAGKANYSFYLWNLLNLSLWHDQWIDTPRMAAPSLTQAGS